MKDLLKLLLLQFAAAVGIYLLLFILGKTMTVIVWIAIITAISLFLYRRKNGNGFWWWEKAKRAAAGIIFRAAKGGK